MQTILNIGIFTMKQLLFIIISIALSTGCSTITSQKKEMKAHKPKTLEAILKLDTKGHTGLIRDIIITKGGELISASDDKTIRVWDIESGKEKRKILGEVGAGSEGMIYAIALSSDERYLAAGGFLNSHGNYEYGNIRIYNYKCGKLLKVLKSHTNIVNDLFFSNDDKFLISGSGDKTAKIWSVENNFALFDTLVSHTSCQANSKTGQFLVQKCYSLKLKPAPI
jgi:WD40 repeat protein